MVYKLQFLDLQQFMTLIKKVKFIISTAFWISFETVLLQLISIANATRSNLQLAAVSITPYLLKVAGTLVNLLKMSL